MIYRGQTPEQCLELSRVLMETGVRFFGVTMNSDNTLEAIRLLRDELGPEAHIGAGTVTKVEQVNDAAEAGA